MVKNAIAYLGSSLFIKIVPFLLLPMLTRYLSPEEYGLVAILQLVLSFYLALFGVLNLNIPRTYFSLSKKQFDIYFSSLALVMVIITIVSFLLSFVYVLLDGVTFGLRDNWLLAMPVIACLSMANLLNLTLLRTEEKPFNFAGWEITHSFLNLTLSLLLVVVIGMQWQGRALGIVIPIGLIGLLGIINLVQKQRLTLNWKWEYVKDTFGVSLPLIPHAISAILITYADLLILERLLGADTVGIYSVGYQIGMVVMLFTDAFLKAWQPWFYKKLNNSDSSSKQTVVKYTYLFIAGLVVGALFYWLIAKSLFPFVVGENFESAVQVVLPVCIGYMLFGIYQIFFPYLVHVKKTKLLAFISPVAALVNITSNFYLIPEFGMVGAAYSTIIAYLISASFVVLFSTKYFPMPWFTRSQL